MTPKGRSFDPEIFGAPYLRNRAKSMHSHLHYAGIQLLTAVIIVTSQFN